VLDLACGPGTWTAMLAQRAVSVTAVDGAPSFWALVGDALVPGGRVVFVDHAYRAREELVYGPESSVIMRLREGADGYRIVKMAHTSGELAARLAELGWSFEMRDHGPFFWGLGQRSPSK
jgi:hypothetical protein